MNNKRIFKSLVVILAVFGLVVGGTWAYFSTQGTVAGNTFSTGVAELEIRRVDSGQGWQSEVLGVDWENLYPGWNESYQVQLRNVGSVGLDVIPQIIISSDPSPRLRNIITLQLFDGDDAVGPEWTLAQWGDNETPIEHIAQDEEGQIWTLKFSFIDTGEDQSNLQNQDIEFDLVFGGKQSEASLAKITNVTQNKEYDDIRSAINDANEGDEIVVPEGNYDHGDTILDINVVGLILRSEYLGRATLRGNTIQLWVDGVEINGFIIEDTGGERAIAPGGNSEVIISNNVIRSSYRGIQGDVHGRPTNLTITNNRFESSFGVAGTEDVSGLTITGNVFDTTDEAIGLGVGVQLVGDPTDYVSHLLTTNIFVNDGTVVDYRP